VLDDVEWSGRTPTDRGRYTGGLGPEQIAFVKNDLALVPREQLVVLMMHIPLVDVKDRLDLYRLIEQRPFTMSISGHTHWQDHRFITKEDGWRGPEPHHHVINVTVSGGWWGGAPDERSIPNALMSDGRPNGYSILTFDGRKYSIEYKAASRSKEYQMNIYAPDAVASVDSGTTEVVANVFGASERSKVEMRVGRGEWRPMTMVLRPDPQFLRLKEQETGPKPPPGRALPGPKRNVRLWRAMLPGSLKPGVTKIEVRTTDMFGNTYKGDRVLTIR